MLQDDQRVEAVNAAVSVHVRVLLAGKRAHEPRYELQKGQRVDRVDRAVAVSVA